MIQVIGETSNKAAEPRKFVQTFVLAQQPSGYFVLNDILRYIKEEGDEEPTGPIAEVPVIDEATPAPPPAAPAAPASAADEDTVQDEAPKDEARSLDAGLVEQKLHETNVESNANGGATDTEASKPSEAKPEAAAPTNPEAAALELAEEDAKEPEKPQDPTPSPAVKPAAPQTEPVPELPPAPPKPMTWANRAAAAAGPRPVVPLPKTATPPAQNQNRVPAPAAAPASSPAAVPAQQASAPLPATDAAGRESSGWQTAGADAKRQNRPLSISGNFAEKEGTMGYVKYVTDKVQDADLRSALTAHGELTYFDINRQKVRLWHICPRWNGTR